MGKNKDLKRLALQSIVFSIDAVMKKIESCCKELPVIDTGEDRIPDALAHPTIMKVENVEVENGNESIESLSSSIFILANAFAKIEKEC